jgi:hypothetical protein
MRRIDQHCKGIWLWCLRYLFFLSPSLSFSAIRENDTAMVLFIDYCDDKSVNSCWDVRDYQNEYPFFGGSEYDIVARRIKHENGIYLIGDFSILKSTDTSIYRRINYLDFKIEDLSKFLNGIDITNVGFNFYKYLERNYPVSNYFYQKKTAKKCDKASKQILKKFSCDWATEVHQFESGWLFEVEFKYLINDDEKTYRKYLNLNEDGVLSRPFVKESLIQVHHIISIESLRFIPAW